MRKVIFHRKIWPRYRNASAAIFNYASPVAALEANQGPLVHNYNFLHQRSVQSLQKTLLGDSGHGLRSGLGVAHCSSLVQFSLATSRSSKSVQCLLPSSASVSNQVQPTSVPVNHSDPIPNTRVSLSKVERNFIPAAISSYSDRDDHRNKKEGNFEGFIPGKSLSSWNDERIPIVSEEVNETGPSARATIRKNIGNGASRIWDWELGVHANRVSEERAGLAFQTSIGNRLMESTLNHVGIDLSLYQIMPQMSCTGRIPQDSETALQWSLHSNRQSRGLRRHFSGPKLLNSILSSSSCTRLYSSDATQDVARNAPAVVDHSQRAVVVALVCNFVVFSMKVGVWFMTSSHVMLAEAVHSAADLANQGLLAYGLISSRRAPDALHPYGYSRERFVWSLISAVGIFCLGCGATIVHGVQNLATAEPLSNVTIAAAVLTGSMIMEGASLYVAYGAVKKGAAAEGMSLREYLWRGHDPTSVAVLMEDGAACAGLGIAGIALTAAEITGNPMWDALGSIVVGGLLGGVALFLIQRNRQALLGRSIDDVEMRRIINLLIADPVVEGLYDCKSEVIGPGEYRFKAEIDFNGVVIVQNYLQRVGRDNWMEEFRKAVRNSDGSVLDRVMAEYGEEVVSAVGCEVDRLEKDIQKLVPGIRHVDIEAHNPNGPTPREKFYLEVSQLRK
uniref:Cation efflux protein transmembrane domain-containing protein n=1 Tax=Physcomitrium patens TaxID=3218 RepID=A0A7I4C918_PHYPA